MNLKKIMLRRECCSLIKDNGLKWELTGLLDEETLKSGCRRISEENISQKIMAASAQIQKKIIASPVLLDYVCRMLSQELTISELAPLIEEIPVDEIITYPAEQIIKTVKGSVPRDLQTIFLRYYAGMDMDVGQCRKLCYALTVHKKNVKSINEEFLDSHKMLFCSNALAGQLRYLLNDYERFITVIAEKEAVFRVIEYISLNIHSGTMLDDENLTQLEREPEKILRYLLWVESFYENQSQMQDFCTLWLLNHALLYDLEQMKKKVEMGCMEEARRMLNGRASYVSFFYNEHFHDVLEEETEELIIYAITNRKKAFMKLVRANMDFLKRIPNNSVLFDRTFYTKVININTMNLKNLRRCQTETKYSIYILNILSDRGYTFEEVVTLINLPKEYSLLYTALAIPEVDKRLLVIRQLVKKQCLNSTMDVERIAAKLSIKPLCQWMQEEFAHIRGIDANVSMMLLQEYDQILHLIPDITSVSEARYVASGVTLLHDKKSMDEVRKSVLKDNPEWLYLKEAFHFTDDFVKENSERIKQFIYDDGAYIMWKYYKGTFDIEEDLRRLTAAELMGRFRELKYHGDDLSREIDYSVTDSVKALWMENLHIIKDRLHVWEEDGLIPVMKIGEIPEHTCLSYLDGAYKRCLLACHDSNKKVLYLSCDGQVVLRAAVRFTKTSFEKVSANRKAGSKALHFADLEHLGKDDGYREQREYLTIFLEKVYISRLPQNMQAQAVGMLFTLLRKKASRMNALLMASLGYKDYHPENMVCSTCAVYISKSKAGEQYLDSLGGKSHVDKEGRYVTNQFLVDKDWLKFENIEER